MIQSSRHGCSWMRRKLRQKADTIPRHWNQDCSGRKELGRRLQVGHQRKYVCCNNQEDSLWEADTISVSGGGKRRISRSMRWYQCCRPTSHSSVFCPRRLCHQTLQLHSRIFQDDHSHDPSDRFAGSLRPTDWILCQTPTWNRQHNCIHRCNHVFSKGG
eukprot:05293_6